MSDIKLYENYHKYLKLQRKIISINDFTYRNILQKIVRYIPKKGSVLDIGSATGTLSFYLASKGLNVEGVELSKEAIKYSNANKKLFSLENVTFKNLSIEKFITIKKYDFIICFEVLEHLDNDIKILDKIYNLMKKESIFTLSVPSANAPLYRLGFLKKFDQKVGHLRRYELINLKNKVKKARFTILKVYKTEGIVRNLIFTNNFFGFFVKFMRFRILNNIISKLDELTISLFGESQFILICKKK